MATAYSAAAASWAAGPMRVYGPLAEGLVARCPIDLRGRTVLDHGAGTGAVSGAMPGANVVAVDRAVGMLLDRRASRPPAVAGDAVALPFRSRSFDVVVAAFSLNHLLDPAVGVREAGRVAREWVLASAYAADDHHPVKQAVDRALTEAGWSPPPWHRGVAARACWTVPEAIATIERAGLVPELVEQVHVLFDDLGPSELVRWRLGMAQCAAFVGAHDQAAIERRALALLDGAAPLVRSVIFSVARVR